MRFAAKTRISTRHVPWAFLAVTAAVTTAFVVATTWRLGLAAVFILLTAALVLSVRVSTAPRKPSKEEHEVVADAEGVTVDGALAMSRDEIANAFCAAGDDGVYAVHLDGRPLRRGCSVFVESEAEGAALLAALAIDPAKTLTRFRALPPWARRLRSLAVLLGALPWFFSNAVRFIPNWGLAVIAALYAVILLPTVLPQHVEVGHDGIFLRWLGNKRFIAFSSIESASASKIGVDLRLRGDRQLEIRLTQNDGAAAMKVKALLGRILHGLEAHRGLSRADEEAFLARGERDVATWMDDMRALGAGGIGGYRAAAIPRERLWAVVENAAAEASAREGAALALSALLDDEERARLREASRTASPRVRIALDGVGRERDPARLRVAIQAAETEEELAPDSVVTRAATSGPPRR